MAVAFSPRFISAHLSLRNGESVSVRRLPVVRLYQYPCGTHVLEVDDVRRSIPELSSDGVQRGRLSTPRGHGYRPINSALKQP